MWTVGELANVCRILVAVGRRANGSSQRGSWRMACAPSNAAAMAQATGSTRYILG